MSLSVLVVVSDAASRGVLVDALHTRGHLVAVAESVEPAWRLHERDPFHILILDWASPVLGSPELARRVRAMPRGRYPYILAFGGGEPEDLYSVLEAGANAVLDGVDDPGHVAALLAAGERHAASVALDPRPEEQDAPDLMPSGDPAVDRPPGPAMVEGNFDSEVTAQAVRDPGSLLASEVPAPAAPPAPAPTPVQVQVERAPAAPPSPDAEALKAGETPPSTTHRSAPETPKRPRPSAQTVALAVLCVLFWGLALHFGISVDEPLVADRLAFASWVASIGCFVALVRGYERRAPSRAVTWPPPAELALLGGITLVALLARAVDVGNIPFPFQADEASVALEGEGLLADGVRRLFGAGWSGQPYLSFLPVGMFVGVFGPETLGARVWPVLQGTATIPLLYLLGRRLFTPRVGLTAAAFLAAWPFHVHFSRLSINNISDAFFAVLVIWLVIRATEEHRVADYVWAGMAAGFTWYSYAGTRLVFGLAALYLVFVALRSPGRMRADWRGWLAMGAAVVVVAGPQLVFFAGNPDIFMTRTNASSAIQTGWLTQEAARQGVSPLLVLGESFVRSLTVFIWAPLSPGLYDAPTALLDHVSAALFLIGLVIATLRVLQPRFFVPAVQFWAVIVLGGALTVEAPYVARFVQAAPAVALLAALGFDVLVRAAGRVKPLPPRLATGVALAVFVLIGLGGIRYYFFDYTPSSRLSAADANTEIANVLASYVLRLGPAYQVYFAGAPQMTYRQHPAIAYLSHNRPGVDLFDPLTPAMVPVLAPGQAAVFIAVSGRRADLDVVEAAYPGGQRREFTRRHRADEALFFAYEVTGPSQPL